MIRSGSRRYPAATMDLRIGTRLVGDAHVVELDGLADLASIPLLQSHLRRAIGTAPGATVVVDVDGLVALDDVALGVLIGAASTAREQGGDLEVLTTSERWRARLHANRFDRAVTVRGDTSHSPAVAAPTAAATPYVAVIFASVLTGAEPDAYEATAARMEALAAERPGYLGIESTRGTDGLGITISYWRTEDDAREWKQHAEHLLAQAEGRDTWYARYRVRVATVTREYSYDADVDPDELLHLALPDDWNAARAAGEYRVSTRGRSLDEEGFIHCAYRDQFVGVANRFYSDLGELVILHVDPERLTAEVREEPAAEGSTELFPHVYGPIPTDAVIATTWWERGDDGVWHRPLLF